MTQDLTRKPIQAGTQVVQVEPSGKALAFFDYMCDIEFWLKIALSCVFFQWVFAALFKGIDLTTWQKITVYFLVNTGSYYTIASTIEYIIKRRDPIAKARSTRAKGSLVNSQPYQLHRDQILRSLVQNYLIAGAVILSLREVHRSVHFGWNFGWFFMSIVITDFAFYAHHRWLLHNHRLRRLLLVHAVHHSYRDSSGFVTGHKSFADMIINFVLADLVVLILFGFDFHQLLAWTLVINLFNIESHSAISLLYIGTDFHDRHHTRINGNYGIHGVFDKLFGTFITATRRTGLLFPSNTLAAHYFRREANKRSRAGSIHPSVPALAATDTRSD
jgi:hypothetical protein